MPQKKHKPEEIVAKLRQVDVLLSQDRTIGVTPFTHYRWRKEFGGLKGDQVKRLKELAAVPGLGGERQARRAHLVAGGAELSRRAPSRRRTDGTPLPSVDHATACRGPHPCGVGTMARRGRGPADGQRRHADEPCRFEG